MATLNVTASRTELKHDASPADAYSRVDNEGAIARTDVDLPSAAPGARREFLNTNGFGMRIYPESRDRINVEGSLTTAGTGYIEATADGAAITLYCSSAGTWWAISRLLTWTVT